MQAAKSHSRAELERVAREQYQRRHGAAGSPKIRNVQALVTMGERRPLWWRRRAYVVPPLSFEDGRKLLMLWHVLKEGRSTRQALAHARRALHRLVRTRHLRRRPLLNPFRHASVDDARHLIDFFLDIPDDSTPATGGSIARTIDMMDGLLEFARTFPAFIGADGLPVSWAHYQYGLRHLSRASARETLRSAQAFRAAQAAKLDDWRQYSEELRSLAGWN